MNLILHACCAPCSAPILESLGNQGIKPTIFYYNPNIYPLDEYQKRRDEIVKYAAKLDIDLIEGDYNHDEWLAAVQGYENEPERGSRCLLCFKMRLKATAEAAAKIGCDTIASSLSSSRWKSLAQIDEAGEYAVGSINNKVSYWAKNWRKGGLQQRRNELLKENGFYNQLYCGCEYSMPCQSSPSQTSPSSPLATVRRSN